MRITPTSSPIVFQRSINNKSNASETSGSSQTASVQAALSPQAQLETIAQTAINRAATNRRQQVEAITIDMRHDVSNFTPENLAASMVMPQILGGK